VMEAYHVYCEPGYDRGNMCIVNQIMTDSVYIVNRVRREAHVYCEPDHGKGSIEPGYGGGSLCIVNNE